MRVISAGQAPASFALDFYEAEPTSRARPKNMLRPQGPATYARVSVFPAAFSADAAADARSPVASKARVPGFGTHHDDGTCWCSARPERLCVRCPARKLWPAILQAGGRRAFFAEAAGAARLEDVAGAGDRLQGQSLRSARLRAFAELMRRFFQLSGPMRRRRPAHPASTSGRCHSGRVTR